MFNMEIRKILNQSFKTDFDKNSLNHHNVLKKAKRIRSAFTTNQILYLENEFLKSPYVGVVNRKDIANKLNIPERAIKVWFQNRRMKEKKDVAHRPTEYHNYDKTVHNGTFVNDQLSNVETLQSNNNLCSHSILPQPKSITSLNKATIDNFLKKNHEQVLNTTKNMEIEKKSTADVISHKFQNNAITSSTNDAKRNAELSIELLKKYKNHLHPRTMKKTIKTKTLQTNSDVKKRRLNSQNIEQKNRSTIPRTTPSTVKHQQTITQIPSGYIPLYPQQHCQQYPSPGNIIWQPMGAADMPTLMPMCDFALIPNPHTIPQPITKPNNVQKSQCSCNCHTKSQTNAFTFSHENQPQFVIAVPFHKPPLQFGSSI